MRILSAVLWTGWLVGCGGKGTPSGDERRFSIGVCVAGETEATREMHRAIDADAGREDASILWASADENEAMQEEIFERFYHQGVKGIIFQPVNPLTAGILIDGANKHGIPVVGIGSIPESGQLGLFVMPDLQKAAESLVRNASRMSNRSGRILVFMSQYADSMEIRLTNTIITMLKENGSAFEAYGMPPDSIEARRSISSVLFTPALPSAVIGTRELYAIEAADLFRLSLVSPRPVFACYSPYQSAKNALNSGRIDIVVDPQPAEIGTEALSGIMHLIKRLPIDTHEDVIRTGQLLVPVLKTPVRTLTEKNALR